MYLCFSIYLHYVISDNNQNILLKLSYPRKEKIKISVNIWTNYGVSDSCLMLRHYQFKRKPVGTSILIIPYSNIHPVSIKVKKLSSSPHAVKTMLGKEKAEPFTKFCITEMSLSDTEVCPTKIH